MDAILISFALGQEFAVAGGDARAAREMARHAYTIRRHTVRDVAQGCCFADTGPRLLPRGSKLGPGCRASYSIALAIELSLAPG